MKTIGKLRLLDAFTLKVIMAVLMLMDHLRYFLPELGWPLWWHQAARVVAPMFAFLVAEGMAYTKSREKYILRMYAVAAVMLVADWLFLLTLGDCPNLSIIMSLAVSASMVYCIEKLRENDGNGIMWAALFLVLVLSMYYLRFEGMYIVPTIVLICFYTRRSRLLMCVAYLAGMVLLSVLNERLGIGRYVLSGDQRYMMLAVIPFLLYNGKRGAGGAFPKYFFYVFYPVHIWVLFLVRELWIR
ncbi:MAG: conjugal transfer protein TraX [Oscillospiraceae bacterium]|nr:conjugal transfer protein TraX [Oscillospiraceae bacterium]